MLWLLMRALPVLLLATLPACDSSYSAGAPDVARETSRHCLHCGWIQSKRGHVGIDALSHILPEWADRGRRIFADVASLAFCAFFCWKSWTLLAEAWEDGQTTSSSWNPPLAIPYGLMSVGMTVLVAQLVLQVLARGIVAESSVHHPLPDPPPSRGRGNT